MEVLFTAKAKVQKNPSGDTWDCTIERITGESTVSLTKLIGLTSADIYFKTGVKTPAEEIDETEGRGNARKILEEGIASLGSRTLVPSTEIINLFLDAMNKLGETNAN